MRTLASVVLAAFVLAGCAASPGPVQSSAEPSGQALGLKIYGNFCGPGYPAIRESSRQVELAALEGIAAKDSLDSYCKDHDICYTKTFHPNAP